jgi:NADH dehydrogenase [ubiquinone] 1 alpha subcomplex assembly factor 5
LLSKYNKSLVPDGVFLGNMYNQSSFQELRLALNYSETEREGGQSPNVLIFPNISDVGNLLQKLNYSLPSIHMNKYKYKFEDLTQIFEFLKCVGETNFFSSKRPFKRRDAYYAAIALYSQLFNEQIDQKELDIYKDDNRIVKVDLRSVDSTEYVYLTIDVINFIAWKYHEAQPKPKERGSAEFSLKDFANDVFESGDDPTLRIGRISMTDNDEFILEEMTDKIKKRIEDKLGKEKLKEILDNKSENNNK